MAAPAHEQASSSVAAELQQQPLRGGGRFAAGKDVFRHGRPVAAVHLVALISRRAQDDAEKRALPYLLQRTRSLTNSARLVA